METVAEGAFNFGAAVEKKLSGSCVDGGAFSI